MDRSQPSGPEQELLAPAMRSLIAQSVASVVLIIRLKPVEDGVQAEGLGSGFCWQGEHGDTLIVTNRHVVSNNTDVEYRYSVSFGGKGGSRFAADLVGVHPLADIAVLRAAITPRPSLLDFRKSQAWTGEEVVAVGNPLGYTTSFSKGIISAVDRENFATPTAQPIRAIQTDAAINRGNSGGPLLGMDGKVVGVNAHGDREDLQPWPVEELDLEKSAPIDIARINGNPLMVRPQVDLQGVNFAVPADLSEPAAQEIVEATGEGVALGELGITYDPELWTSVDGILSREQGRTIHRTMTESMGVVVANDPDPESPAAHAGLTKGDTIVSINDEPVDHPGDLNAWAIKRSLWEREVPLRFIRDGQMIEVPIRGQERRVRS